MDAETKTVEWSTFHRKGFSSIQTLWAGFMVCDWFSHKTTCAQKGSPVPGVKCSILKLLNFVFKWSLMGEWRKHGGLGALAHLLSCFPLLLKMGSWPLALLSPWINGCSAQSEQWEATGMGRVRSGCTPSGACEGLHSPSTSSHAWWYTALNSK